jgi:two-component system NtrC family sensor kinase
VAFERTYEGVSRASTIVSAMKNFSHASGPEMAPADLNEAIRTTLVVCANEYKYAVGEGTTFTVRVPLAGR